MRLENKTILISGVGRGMGSAMSLLFAQEGANVALVARKPDIIQPLADKLREMGREVISIVADMTIAEDIENVVKLIADTFGTLGGFVSLPGGGFRHVKDMVDMDAPFFEMMFNNHIATIFHSVQAIFPLMKDHGGSIITIAASNTVLRDGNVAYSMVKEGVIGMSKNLAREMHPYNIRVNTISPGLIRIPIESERIELPKAPLIRRGQPEDIAYAALYLMSDESRWVTGQNLVIDGGADIFVDRNRTFD